MFIPWSWGYWIVGGAGAILTVIGIASFSIRLLLIGAALVTFAILRYRYDHPRILHGTS